MFQNNLLMAAASISTGGFSIDNSCRFNTDDTANLSISNGTSTSNTIATIAFWFKIGIIANKQTMFGVSGLTEGLVFDGSNKLYIVHGAGDVAFKTTQVFRDTTAWYHCVVIYDTTESVDINRVKLYINGVQVTAFTATTWPTEDEVFGGWNKSGSSNVVGRGDSGDPCYDGYLSEFHSIDGVAYGPTTFGEFDDYGVWRPINVTGVTYGNNGFYLDFTDSSNLGNDVSGNDNDLTSSGLAAADQMEDTPTKNFCTLNPINTFSAYGTGTISDGNLTMGSTNTTGSSGTMVMNGKTYWEVTSNATVDCYVGIIRNSVPTSASAAAQGITGDYTGFVNYVSTAGSVYKGATLEDTYASWASGDVMGMAYDPTVPDVEFFKNNVSQGSIGLDAGDDYQPWVGAAANTTSLTCNFGQTAFTYTPPTGFKALNTANLNTPTILDGTENFQTTLYQGTGATRTVGQQSNSYYNTYGSGDRTSIIEASGVGGSYSPAANEVMVNGNLTDGPGIQSFATDMNFKFVFTQAVNITEVEIHMQSSGNDVGDNWVWEGSNNDFSSTTALSSAIDMSSNALVETHSLDLIGASDTYLYYRLRNTNGNGGSSTQWEEFEFRVAPLNTRSTFQPDMVWMKNRSQADPHMLIDATRGVTKELNPENARIQSTDANGLTAFATSGFTLGTGAGGYNDNLESFVAWQWLAGGGAGSSNEVGSINTITTTVNTAAGISIGTYIGTGANATIGHGLGVAPQMVVVREFERVQTWTVYHEGIAADAATDYIYWDFNFAAGDDALTWNDTAPTSTVFSLGSSAAANADTFTHVYYAFANIESYSRFGSYTGNGVANGPVIYTGFKPALVIIKKSSGTGSWVMYDSQRSPYNEIDDQLVIDEPYAETTGSEELDFLSNGFKIKTGDSDVNTSTGNYIYMSFAENPFGGDGATPAPAF